MLRYYFKNSLTLLKFTLNKFLGLNSFCNFDGPFLIHAFCAFDEVTYVFNATLSLAVSSISRALIS